MEYQAARTPVISMQNIHKIFPGVHALKGVKFDLFPGEVHALMGENGAGKSTLIKIAAGAYDYEGDYFIDNEPAKIHKPLDAISKGISVIYQELNLVSDLSVAENIFFGRLPSTNFGRVRWKQLYEKTSEYLKEVGLIINPKKKIHQLPVAQQQLVEIAKSLSLNARVIIMDEPTSALCSAEIENLFELIVKLKQRNVSIVYVSHKLEEVLTIADRITVLRDGIYIDTRPVSEVTKNSIITMMVGRELSALLPKTEPILGEELIRVENLSSDKVRDISFHARKGEIIGFAGLMGSGRTELAKALIGMDRRRSGTIKIDGKDISPNSPVKARHSGIGLIPEDRKQDGIFPDLGVKENITIVSLKELSTRYGINGNEEKKAVQTMLDSLSIRTPSMKQLIAKLSGGNQQKVIVARWLMNKHVKVIIIDEPTRGIDVGAKAEIYKILDELAHSGMTIIMMSSEMPEIIGMCDRIYVMSGGEITNEFKRGEVTQEEILASCIDHT